MRFQPRLVFFEPEALRYPLGRRLYERFRATEGVEIRETTSHNRVRGIPGDTPGKRYGEAKRTLVVGVRRSQEFQTSKPSAEYALPVVTGCPGHCHYCYLQTSLGDKPYVRVYVNVDEILERASRYVRERAPDITRFEGACVSDPVAVEPYTGSLAATVRHFAAEEYGRFRFVTKYDEVDSLLGLDHRGHTEVRFSVNTPYVVRTFEPGTASMEERLRAAARVAGAGYPLGFVIAPILIYDGWREDYARLVASLRRALPSDVVPFFELITHRFTPRAKRLIRERYPESPLVMDEEERVFRWGQFGYGKYVYSPDQMEAVRALFADVLERHFPGADVRYLV